MAIVATDPLATAGLTDMDAPEMKGLVTWWFSSDTSPLQSRFILMDASHPSGGPAGPVLHATVVSEVAPSYAPPGAHLIQATTLLDGAAVTEAEIRTDLERMYATSTTGWELIARHEVPHALPAQLPPLVDRQSQRVSERIFVAGDHRDTASINGALVSGERAAGAITGILPVLS